MRVAPSEINYFGVWACGGEKHLAKDFQHIYSKCRMEPNAFFLPPVRLNQAFEGENSGGGGLTRRTFIKRTGGATAATFIAWQLSSVHAGATETEVSSESIEREVTIPGMDFGIDEEGYRIEMLKFDNGHFSWKYTSPNAPMTLPHDPPEGAGAPPNQKTIIVTVKPVDLAVTFRMGGAEPDCLEIVGVDNDGSGTVKIKVRAINFSTPVPGGEEGQGGRRPDGTLIEAVVDDAVIAKGTFYVIKPKKIKTYPAGTIIHAMLAKPASTVTFHAKWEESCVDQLLEPLKNPPRTRDAPGYYMADATYTVLDQFGEVLGSMYKGVAVHENLTSWIAWLSASGTFVDPVGADGNLNRDSVFLMKIAGHQCGSHRRNLTIENDDNVTADYVLKWD